MANRAGEWVKTWAEKSNLHVEYFFETDSTSDLAKSYDYKGFDPVLFVTENQTKGRGRGSNTWTSPSAGTALLCTFSFGLENAPQPITTPLIGLACYRSLKGTFEIKDLSIKAPNDLYIGKKKVGGLLVEVLSEGSQHRLIVGFGLNVLESPKLEIATDLAAHTKVDQSSFCSFLNALFVEFTELLPTCTEPELHPSSCQQLLLALNANPTLKEKYKAVESDGSLRTNKNLISWMEL